MVAVVKRRVPKRHDGIPHVLVDRSLVLNDVARDRRQQAVDQAGQALGIAPVERGDASEAAHIGEQQRHLTGFAAQYQALRAARQLVNQGRRQVLPEGAAHEAALALLMEVVVEHEKSVDEKACAKRIDDRQQHSGPAEGEPGRSEEHTSELQSLMRISYAVFCLKKKKKKN